LWLNRHVVPPYYPNAVALTEDASVVEEGIGELARLPQRSGWALKDSFGHLDLAARGLGCLFRAEWIVRPASLLAPHTGLSDLRWERVESGGELERWEQAWRQAGHVPDEDAWKRIFPAALLEQRDVAVLAAYRGDRMIAGAMANLAAGHVGVTNIFSAEAETPSAVVGCVELAMNLFPNLPLAGYESGGRLRTMTELGFEPIGPLAVWAMPAGGGR
jgi:hypothetical protein